jgi:hypothetical protein
MHLPSVLLGLQFAAAAKLTSAVVARVFSAEAAVCEFADAAVNYLKHIVAGCTARCVYIPYR